MARRSGYTEYAFLALVSVAVVFTAPFLGDTKRSNVTVILDDYDGSIRALSRLASSMVYRTRKTVDSFSYLFSESHNVVQSAFPSVATSR